MSFSPKVWRIIAFLGKEKTMKPYFRPFGALNLHIAQETIILWNAPRLFRAVFYTFHLA